MTFPDIDSLSLRQQIAQMVIVRSTGFLFDHQLQYPQWEADRATLQHLVAEVEVGGVIFLGASAAELALKIQSLQQMAPIPLLVCADIEEGVGQRFSGATWFPPPMALGAIARTNPQQAETYAEQMGHVIAQEAQAIGINWLLAPIVDVNNNPDNPVINVRAFGETPETVSRLTTAFIRGAKAAKVLTCAKHFPGHGDTATDSHLDLPLISHGLDRLEQVELPPFQRAIAAGVDAVMSAHLQVPALDPDRITTFSERVMTGLLRRQWGFEGLLVTDALVMGAIADRYGNAEAAVRAIEAGADLLMMPQDAMGAIEAVVQAVESGRLSAVRIRESLERIWRAKQQVCEPSQATIDAGSLVEHLAQPPALQAVEATLRSSMRIDQPNPARLSQSRWQTAAKRNLILLDDAIGSAFLTRTAPAIGRPQALGYQTQIIDGHTPAVQDFDWRSTLLQIFIRGNPLRSNTAFLKQIDRWLEMLSGDTDQLHSLVVYGSPYIADRLRDRLPSDVAMVFTYGQMPPAQTLALEALCLDRNRELEARDREGMF